MAELGNPSDLEHLKIKSDYLRGTIEESLADPLTGAVSDDDTKLLKFHGSYQQDDRDVRDERRRKKLEPAYQFMLRVKAAGGVTTPEQWLVLEDLAERYGSGSLKLTTRQSYQFHGILKHNLKSTIKEVNEALMTTIAACGDVCRNVMCNPNPYQSNVHKEIYDIAIKVSEKLTPQTNAYHEIWLDKEKVVDTKQKPEDVEPFYKDIYLPRKFKVGIATPPTNDIDVFSQDVALIAIIEDDELVGFNVGVGGGMGMTHGDTKTYPQIARVIGYTPKEEIIDVVEKIALIQHEHGNRSDRMNARFKYTVDRLGLEWIRDDLNRRLGWELAESRPYKFDHNGDRLGWVEGDGKWHYTLFIQNGRVRDFENYKLKTAIREIAKIHKGDFRLTGNQNLIIANVAKTNKPKINKIIKEYGLTDGKQYTGLRRNSMACVAFPTCGLAMAESERYLPQLIDKIEVLLDEAGLKDEEITVRMSGCPNGCSRPALAELAFVGKAPGKYNMYLGAGHAGERLNKLYRENIAEKEILKELSPILNHYAKEREAGEHFGDFTVRAGYVKATDNGMDFHD